MRRVLLVCALLQVSCSVRVSLGLVDAGSDAAPRDAEVPAQDASALDTPVERLRVALLGTWCGTARAANFQSSLRVTFRGTGLYLVECRENPDCAPWPSDREIKSGHFGRYAISFVTFDGEGFGVMRDVLEDGTVFNADVDRLVLDAEARSLRFERFRVLDDGQRIGPTTTQLTRCDPKPI